MFNYSWRKALFGDTLLLTFYQKDSPIIGFPVRGTRTHSSPTTAARSSFFTPRKHLSMFANKARERLSVEVHCRMFFLTTLSLLTNRSRDAVELADLRRTNSACIDITSIQAGYPVALAMKKHDVQCTSTITATVYIRNTAMKKKPLRRYHASTGEIAEHKTVKRVMWMMRMC